MRGQASPAPTDVIRIGDIIGNQEKFTYRASFCGTHWLTLGSQLSILTHLV